MERKPTYEELLQRVRELEKNAVEQDRTERRLKHQSYILNVMTSQMEDMVYFKNRKFRYIFSSKPHCEKILKCAQDECVGKTDTEIAPFYRPVVYIEGIGETLVDSDTHTRSRGKPSTFTEKALIDGKELYFEVCKTPLFDRHGNFAGIVGCARDITDSIRIRREMSEQQALLRCLVDSIPAMVYFKDTDLKYLAANKAFADMVGFQDKDIPGKTDYDFFSEDQAKQRRTSDQGVISLGEPVMNKEEPLMTPRGDAGWAMTTKVPYNDEEDKIAGMVGVTIDITERKGMEEALQRRDAILQSVAFAADSLLRTPYWEDKIDDVLERLRKATGAGSVIIFENNRNSGILTMARRRRRTLSETSEIRSRRNKPELEALYYQKGFERWLEMLGRGEVIYGHVKDFPKEERKVLAFQGIRTIAAVPVFEGSVWWGFITFNEYLKEREWLPTEISVLKAAADTLGSAIRRRRSEDVLRQAKEEAEQANQAKTHFLANISHEIRTPMNAIVALTELTLNTELTQDQRNYMLKVGTSAHKLLGILNDILDFSGAEAGKLVAENTNFRLQDILDEIADMFAQQAEMKGIEMIIGRSRNTPDALIGDPARLRQVLINLVGNAVKFTEIGEVFLYVTTAGKSPDSAMISFSVRDTGIGIEPEKIPHLFSAFTQGDGSTTRSYGGTGIGLAISRSLVKLMKGEEIFVQSEPGKGSNFSFTLPFERQPGGKDTVFPPEAIPSGTKALIVEDNETGRQVLSEMFNAFGLVSDTAASGEDALKKLGEAARSEAAYKLILIDRKMSGIDGMTTSEMIKQDPRFAEIPVIMMTSYDREWEMKVQNEIGINACISKPVKPTELSAAVQKIFGPEKTLPPVIQSPVKILLVEDSEINRKLVMNMLKKTGMEIEAVSDGQKAVRAIKQNSFDAVLMDIEMPVMNGYDAAREIRKDERAKGQEQGIPIIAMSAYKPEDARESCLKAGINDYISKPMSREQLFGILEKWIKNWKSPKKDSAPIVTEIPHINTSETEFPGIDIQAGLERLQGNRELYINLLKRFSEKYSDIAEKISEAVGKPDMTHARHLAHTLKGMAGNLSMTGLFSISRDLEESMKKEITDEIGSGIRKLKEEMNRVIKRIEHLADKPEVEEEEAIVKMAEEQNLSEITAILTRLNKLIRENDIESESYFESVKKNMTGYDIEEEVRELEIRLSGYEFEEADIVLKRIANALGISLQGE